MIYEDRRPTHPHRQIDQDELDPHQVYLFELVNGTLILRQTVPMKAFKRGLTTEEWAELASLMRGTNHG